MHPLFSSCTPQCAANCRQTPIGFSKSNYSVHHLNSKPRLIVRASLRKAQELIQSGIIRSVAPKEANSLVETGECKLLDVRPIWERQRAYVADSIHVPLFVEDKDGSLITLLKKAVHLGYIGLWTGQSLTILNENFLQEVEQVVPQKDGRLIVACGEGLRSMLALKKLHEYGYTNLALLEGGFNRVVDTDFPIVEGETKLQFAAIGGFSKYFLMLLLFLESLNNNLAREIISPKDN